MHFTSRDPSYAGVRPRQGSPGLKQTRSPVAVSSCVKREATQHVQCLPQGPAQPAGTGVCVCTRVCASLPHVRAQRCVSFQKGSIQDGKMD